jgi:hypothetical protein
MPDRQTMEWMDEGFDRVPDALEAKGHEIIYRAIGGTSKTRLSNCFFIPVASGGADQSFDGRCIGARIECRSLRQ